MKLDGTLNINTVIAAASMLVSGALAYATLDKRIAIMEQTTQERSARVEQNLKELKQDIKEISQTINGSKKDRQ